MSDPLGLLSSNDAVDPLGLLKQVPRVPAWMPTADREFQLRQGQPEEKSFLGGLWDQLATDKVADRAKAANAAAVAELTGMPPSIAYDNMDQVSQQLEMRDQPTTGKLFGGLMMAGAAMTPLMPAIGPLAAWSLTSIPLRYLQMAKGAAVFQGVVEATNAAVAQVKGTEYEPFSGKGVSALLPEDTSGNVKALVDLTEVVAQAFAAGGTIKAGDIAGEKLAAKYLRDVTESFANLPRHVYISPEQVQAHFSGKGTMPGEPGFVDIPPEIRAFLKDINISNGTYRAAKRNGIDIEISADKLVHVVDKPWWAEIKGLFKSTPFEETISTRSTTLVPGEKTVKFGGKAGEPAAPAQAAAEGPQKVITGEVTPEAIKQSFMAGKVPAADKGLRQTMILSSGPAGAGKSSTIPREGLENHVISNSDTIGLMMGGKTPETHEAASALAKDLLNEAIAKGHDIFYDSQGTNYHLADQVIEKVLAQGGGVRIGHTEIDADTSIVRSEVRLIAAKEGLEGGENRVVPVDVSIKGYNYSLPTFRALYEKYKGIPEVRFDMAANNVDFDAPIKIFTQYDGKLEIFDKELFDKFIGMDYLETRKEGEIRYVRSESEQAAIGNLDTATIQARIDRLITAKRNAKQSEHSAQAARETEAREGINPAIQGVSQDQVPYQASPTYIDNNGKTIFVDAGPRENFTFYRQTTVGGRDQKVQVRLHSGSGWFKTKAEAIAALAEYAVKHRWTPGGEDPATSSGFKVSKEEFAELIGPLFKDQPSGLPGGKPYDTGQKAFEITYTEPGTGEKTFTVRADDEAAALVRARGLIGWQGRTVGRALSMDETKAAAASMTAREIQGQAAEGKQPWELTQAEYQKEAEALYGKGSEESSNAVAKFHKDHVAAAIAGGKSVPPEVLKDYPDFKPIEWKGGQPEQATLLDNEGNYDIIEARKKGYHDDQLELDLQSYGKEASDIPAAAGRSVHTGPGIETLAAAIPGNLLKRGYVDLRGSEVKNDRDLAAVAQVFRDPRIETFRIFYLKNGKIVAHEGLSSRMPGFVQFFQPKELPQVFYKITQRIDRLGADQIYMLHNHPSGHPKPSDPDIGFTASISGLIANMAERTGTRVEFKGHVIINNKTYGLIYETGRDIKPAEYGRGREIVKPARVARVYVDYKTASLPEGTEGAERGGPSVPNDLLGANLSSPVELAWVVSSVRRAPGQATLLFRGGTFGAVNAIQNIPIGILKSEDASNYLRGRAREFGAIDVIAYVDKIEDLGREKAAALMSNGSLIDVGWKTTSMKAEDSSRGAIGGVAFGRSSYPPTRMAEDAPAYVEGAETLDDINELLAAAARTDQANIPPPATEYDRIRAEAAKLAFESLNNKIDISHRKLARETARASLDEARIDPVYIAMREAVKIGGISRSSLAVTYDKNTITELVRKMPGLVSAEGGWAYDKIADQQGFDTADDMIVAMLDWQGLKKEAGRYAAQYEEKYGDLLTQAEMESFHVDLLEEEANILRKLLGQKTRPSALGIKKVIREQTGQTRVDDLVVSEYEALKAGMIKSERAARAAFREGKLDGVLAEKERQIGMATERREKLLGKEEANKIHDGILALTKDKKIPEDYHDRIADLLEDFDLLPRSKRTGARVESAREFLERQREAGEDVTIPESMLNRIERYGKTHWRELTLDQLREIYDQAKIYAHLGKLKNKLIFAKEAREFEHVVEAIVTEVGKNWGVQRVPEAELETMFVEPGLLEKLGTFKESYLASLTKVETYLRRLDGFKDLGPIHELIYMPTKRASDVEYTRLAEITDKLKELFDPLRDTLTKEKFRIEGVPQFMTRETVIMVALNSGNEGNLAALKGNKVYNWGDAEIRAILQNVTPDEWDLVRGVWDLFETQYPALAQVYSNLSGTSLKKVEGNYFPLVFDRKLSWIADRNATEKELRDFFQSIYTLPSVKTGSTIQRVGGKLPPKLTFQVIFDKLAEVNHYITHAEAVRDVQKVLADPRVRAAIEGAPDGIGGPEAFREMKSWLQDVARQQSDPLSAVESAVKTARINTTTVAMAWKFSTAAMQFLGASNSIYKVGSVEFASALAEFYTNREAMVEQIKDMSTEVSGRAKSFDRDLRDAYKRLGLENFRGSQAIKDSFFSLISLMDMAVAYPTWLAAYNKGMKDLAGDDAKAIEYADMTLRMTQGAGLVKDLAGIQRGAEMKKILSLFYTYFSAYHQMMGDAWLKFKYDKSGTNAWDLMKAWWWLTILPATLEYLLKERDVPTPGKFIASVLQQRLTAYPVIRDITGAVLTKYDYTFSPVAKAGEVMAKTGKEVVAALDPDDEIEWDKFLRYSLESSGYIFGLPTGQAAVTIQGFMDLKNGETSDPTRLLMRKPSED